MLATPATFWEWQRNTAAFYTCRRSRVLGWGKTWTMRIFSIWDQIAIWFVALLAVTVLGWLIWKAWQFWLAFRVLRIYMDRRFPTSTIAPRHIEALRKLQIAWEPWGENGGPVVDRFAPYAVDLGPLVGKRGWLAEAKFHREVYASLVWALENGALTPGQYRLAHLTNASMEKRLRRALGRGLPAMKIEAVVAELPRLEPDGFFRFTDQHRRLLKRLRLDWPDPNRVMWMTESGGYPAPEVHFKRPFGDMSFFYTDMAEILGLPPPNPDQLDPLLERLYLEMWPALQTFVEHVTVDLPATLVPDN